VANRGLPSCLLIDGARVSTPPAYEFLMLFETPSLQRQRRVANRRDADGHRHSRCHRVHVYGRRASLRVLGYVGVRGRNIDCLGSTATHVIAAEGTFTMTVKRNDSTAAASAFAMVGSLTGTWICTYGPGETIAAVMTQNGAVPSGKSSRPARRQMTRSTNSALLLRRRRLRFPVPRLDCISLGHELVVLGLPARAGAFA